MSRRRKRETENVAGLDAATEAPVEFAAPAAPPVDTPAAAPLPPPRSHEPSGETCQAHHFDGMGACQRCKWCKVKLRPNQMAGDCPARA